MYASHLHCVSCGQTYLLKSMYECQKCKGILEVQYDFSKARKLSREEFLEPNTFFDFLPISKDSSIYLGEGNTILIKAEKLGNKLGLKNLLLKCELNNPTGSFKDRPVSIGISKAIEFGYDKVIVASSGNGAGAVAAYSARASIDAIILVPESTPLEKVKQAQFYGAQVIKVKGPYSNCFNLAKKASEQFNIFNLTTTFINPYTLEGDKLVAFEMINQLNGKVPDYIFVPIGAGPLLVGIHKGYQEYRKRFFLDKIPKMAGIQAKGCSPIAQAFLNGDKKVTSEKLPSTFAGGINDGLYGYSKDGDHTLKTIYQSKGFSIFVSDRQIREAQKWLAEEEGLFVEPSAAAGIAGAYKSFKEARLKEDDEVIVILTGHGLKDIGQIKTEVNIPIIENKSSQLLELIINNMDEETKL